MTRQTHKNPRDLTQRVLLLAYLVIFFAPCCSTGNRTSLNSTDRRGMKRAGLIYPKTAQIQTMARATNPLIGCSFSKKWITES